METRKELNVSALENGTVLDHIPAENVYKALDVLGLKDIESQITIDVFGVVVGYDYSSDVPV